MRCKKLICVGILFVLAAYCVNALVIAPFLERKFERLTPEDYDRYVVAAYPEFDISLYGREFFSPKRVSGGWVQLNYLAPQLSDPNTWNTLDGDSEVWKIFRYNLLTNRVQEIQ